jgi:hypothetical protein
MKKAILLFSVLTTTISLHAEVLKTGLILAHDIDSAASLNITISKDLGDNLVSGERVSFRLESVYGTPLIPGASYYAGNAFFYNSYDGLANVYVLNINLYDQKIFDSDSAARVNFFVNLKSSKLVFYKYANGTVGEVAGTVEMREICNGPVQNLSGADKCNITVDQVLGGIDSGKICTEGDHAAFCGATDNMLKKISKRLGCTFECKK